LYHNEEVRPVRVLFGDGTGREPHGSAISIALLDQPAEIESLISLFERIAVEQEWRPGAQLRAYPFHSVYFGLFAGTELAGGLQLVVSSESERLPCLTVWPELGLAQRPDVADIALLALDREYRGQQKLFWLLCVEMWRYCRDHGIATLWVEVTPARLQLYRRLGWPLEIAGDLRLHWGEECYPCHMAVEDVREAIEARAQSTPAYRKLLEQAYR
jgi:GNAT superfamily N-acetyltransferase